MHLGEAGCQDPAVLQDPAVFQDQVALQDQVVLQDQAVLQDRAVRRGMAEHRAWAEGPEAAGTRGVTRPTRDPGRALGRATPGLTYGPRSSLTGPWLSSRAQSYSFSIGAKPSSRCLTP